MKTIREWLEGLPEPYRTQAMNNTIRVGKRSLDSISICNSLYWVIQEAFVWQDSPEGGKYWIDVQKSTIQ